MVSARRPEAPGGHAAAHAPFAGRTGALSPGGDSCSRHRAAFGAGGESWADPRAPGGLEAQVPGLLQAQGPADANRVQRARLAAVSSPRPFSALVLGVPGSQRSCRRGFPTDDGGWGEVACRPGEPLSGTRGMGGRVLARAQRPQCGGEVTPAGRLVAGVSTTGLETDRRGMCLHRDDQHRGLGGQTRLGAESCLSLATYQSYALGRVSASPSVTRGI